MAFLAARAHCWLMVNLSSQDTQVPFHRAALQQVHPKLVLVHEVVPPQVQDPGTPARASRQAAAAQFISLVAQWWGVSQSEMCWLDFPPVNSSVVGGSTLGRQPCFPNVCIAIGHALCQYRAAVSLEESGLAASLP